MNNIIRSLGIILLIILMHSCKKEVDNSFKDIDGNVYKTVTIGSQVWMAENLKTTKYIDNTAITLVTDNTEWSMLAKGGYCFYNNDISNKDTYGLLYNFYAVETGKLCPKGWHVPTDIDLYYLEVNLDPTGGILQGWMPYIAKSMADTSGWVPNENPGSIGNNQASNNSSGFTAIPSGYRDNHGLFNGLGSNCILWMDEKYFGYPYTPYWQGKGIFLRSVSGIADVMPADYQYGYSVRCLKDSTR